MMTFNPKHIFLIVLTFIICSNLISQRYIDGHFNEWRRDQILMEDYGDHGQDILGIDRLWTNSDLEYLYFRIDLTEEIDLDDNNELALYLDLDQDPNTGFRINGIGAEISYYFGAQFGFFNIAGESYVIGQHELSLVVGPSYNSDSYELLISRSLEIDGIEFSIDDDIDIFIHVDDVVEDKIPNGAGGVAYSLSNQEPDLASYNLEKQSNHLRIMSYNVKDDGLFNGQTRFIQERLIKAMNPDIIAFQEIYNNTAVNVENLLESYFPATQWSVLKAGPDIITATRHRMVAVDWIDGNGAFLLEIGSSRDPLIVLNAHLPCCDNEIQRQEEIDEIIEAFKNAKINNLAYPIDDNTPIIFAGDLNLVGSSFNYPSIVQGNILNESEYGPDAAPDWDDSFLDECFPINTGYPFAATWRNEFSNFPPGKLDFIFYTGAELNLQNSFVLNTTGLESSTLSELGLIKSDSYLGSDHLPVIADFRLFPNLYLPLSASTNIVERPKCNGDQTGMVEMVNVAGGLPPYEFRLNAGTFQRDYFFDNLIAGNYSLQVRDANGAVFDSGIFSISEPDPISITYQIINNQIEVFASGGTPPYDFSIDGIQYQIGNFFDIGTNQEETIYILDDNGCEFSEVVPINIDQDNDGFNTFEDCDDSNPLINPNATEIPNNDIDEDCDGILLVIDNDNDGFNSEEDCNDNNPNINPNAQEIPNNPFDEDCDGIALIIDEDNDGFNSDQDCNDNDPAINPNANEIPNNDIDEDCDGIVLIIDMDNDGFNSDEDCDDNNASINPAAIEIPNNGVDEDCNGFDEVVDLDNDGFNSDEDCDDTNAMINPDAMEIPNNNIDEDCDGVLLVIDEDNDGFNSDEDCNDNDPLINPNASEIANNNIDEDCDGVLLIIDEDNDGFNSDEDCDDNNALINPGTDEISYNGFDDDCNPMTPDDDIDQDGFILSEDCDDNNALINPNQIEIPYNNIDDDCNPNTVDDDLDLDGFGITNDCDDNNPNINPNAEEICDELDNNCDGNIDEELEFIAYYTDNDMDGYGDTESEFLFCAQPPGTTTIGGDCDDFNPNIYPGAPEIANNDIDENCNGSDWIISDTEENSINKISVYPNPTSTWLFVEGINEVEYELTFYSVAGSKIAQFNEQKRVDLSGFENGIYLLAIRSLNTSRIVYKRVVKF